MEINQRKHKLSFKNECENKNETNDEECENGPPLKKVRLVVGTNDENNQNNNFLKLTESNREVRSDEEELDDEYSDEIIDANFFAEELSSDDEILAFQYPQNFDITSLLGKTIDLSTESKLKVGNNKYICHTIQNNIKNKFNCVFPSKKGGAVFLKLPVAGQILLREKIKIYKQKIGSFVDVDANEIELTNFNSMKRHPLLGTDWKDHCSKVKKELKKHKKHLRRSLKHEKSLEMAERERKEQKKKLKSELTLLKKKQLHD